MKIPRLIIPRCAALAAALLLLGPTLVSAANTAAGTSVSNQASVAYKVATVDQTAVTSNTLAFLVDQKVNLTITTTDGAAVSVTPGTTGNVLTFTLQNTGNAVQDFHLSATARSGGTGHFGGTDNVNAASVAVFVESGGTVGYQVGEDTATYVDELAALGTKTVYIVGNFTGSYANTNIASYHMLVEARIGGTGSSEGSTLTETSAADTAGSVDIVFADAQGTDTVNDIARDAKFSADSDYIIATATLTVTKTSAVISDPTNSTTNPKAIPGAVVRYTIQVANAASTATATNITVTDSLNTEIVAGTLAFNTATYGAGEGIQVTAPNLNGGAAMDLTNASDGDTGNWNVTGTNAVTVSGITLTAGQSATITFEVTIQ